MEKYNELISNTMEREIVNFVILVAILAAFVIIPVVREKSLNALELHHVIVFLLVIVLSVMIIPYILEMRRDIKEESYVSVETDYYHEEIRSRTSSSYVKFTLYGEEISLEMPRRPLYKEDAEWHAWYSQVFPEGEGHGTIWYAEHSGIIVDLIPDGESDTPPAPQSTKLSDRNGAWLFTSIALVAVFKLFCSVMCVPRKDSGSVSEVYSVRSETMLEKFFAPSPNALFFVSLRKFKIIFAEAYYFCFAMTLPLMCLVVLTVSGLLSHYFIAALLLLVLEVTALVFRDNVLEITQRILEKRSKVYRTSFAQNRKYRSALKRRPC